MHAKSDSEVTSIPPLYFVQSPSRESSHDGEKMSFQSTPVLSPAASPLHHSFGRHSRASSASRFSGNLKPLGGRKVNPQGKTNAKGWPQCNVIEEEGNYDDEGFEVKKGNSRRCYAVLFVLCFALLFAIFALVLWGISRPYKPQVTVKGIVFSNFYVGAGADETGVPTKMVSLNSSMKVRVYNPATFYGIHVDSTPVELIYNQFPIAKGQLQKYYQSRKSYHTVSIVVEGKKVPLYGAGGSMSNSDEDGGIPLELVFGIRSRAYVLGKLVKRKSQKDFHCKFVLDPNKLKPIRLLGRACQYD
ncbi:hypothetical protein KI387_012574 [Taxus chinensis]|uniref:Late embryogenesis abundant protein LEA-2 subgroup domain-containing protein n=1 Tax=Taxus chinensis TaxID=29808 RepID=A0AA38CK17_TAXCH|nr:hypothetical protein KI387_012574 [Taxus chinensis]